MPKDGDTPPVAYRNQYTPMKRKKAVRKPQQTLPLVGATPVEPLPLALYPKPLTDLQLAIDAFDRRFRDAYGQPPLWNAKAVSQVKRLIAGLGLPELETRIARMFAGGLGRFPEPPYTLAVLVSNIDRLVIDKTRPAKPSELLRGDRDRH